MSDINKKDNDKSTHDEMEKRIDNSVEKTPDDIVEETMQGILDDMKDEFEELEENGQSNAMTHVETSAHTEKSDKVKEDDGYEEESEDYPVEDKSETSESEEETKDEETNQDWEEVTETSDDSDSDDVPADDTDAEAEHSDQSDSTKQSKIVGDDWKEKLEEHREKKKKRKKIAIIAGSIVGGLAVIYLAFSFYFMGHFYFATKINGTSFSGKSVKQVEAYMEKQVADYVLTIEEKENVKETIKGSDIELSYKKGKELKKLMKEQNPFLWITSLWNHRSYETTVGVEYNQEKLAAIITKLECMKAENQVAPTAAYPEFNGEEFVIKPEVLGTQINTETFNKEVNEHIGQFDSVLNLEKCKCYALPAFTQESKEVIAAKDAMNKYLTASITYDVNPGTEVVDKALISQWVTVDANMAVTFNHDAVSEFVKGLADKYNTVGKVRTITAPNGKKAEVSGGNFGWKIDKDAEYQKLVANIEAGEVVTREPEYSKRGASHGENDYGSTYAEVDLTAQHMWFIKDGAVVLESDIVTGNPNKGNDTPQGSFSLTYKTRNAVLRGTKKPDGTYEYETPVAFWMPFNGGIGFHDATWQSAFGGSRYLSHGSHGCVNLPYNIAQKLYDYIDQGMPVVCHY